MWIKEIGEWRLFLRLIRSGALHLNEMEFSLRYANYRWNNYIMTQSEVEVNDIGNP